MKTHLSKAIYGGILIFLLAGISLAQAQPRFNPFRNFNNNNSSSSSTFNNNGTVGNAVISVDPQSHNIIVITDKKTSEQISNVIEHLDKPIPQVLIKVVFMEVQRNKSLDVGIEGGWSKALGNGTTGSVAQVFGLAGANTLVTNFTAMGQTLGTSLYPNSGIGPNGFAQIMGADYQATLKAIATAGKAQILSRPSILARDGQLAEIVVGQQVYLPSGVTFTTTGSTTTPIINGSYTDVGIILDVTPFIGNNNLVEMILQPKITSVDTSTPGQVIATGGLLGSPIYAPNINTRSANTVVVTPNAEPVVIGGLIGNTKSSSSSKIPLLGDIPILGRLFRSSSDSNQKNELLIFLTPHIVREPNDLTAVSEHETTNSAIVTNSVSEQELNRFLDRIPVRNVKTTKILKN